MPSRSMNEGRRAQMLATRSRNQAEKRNKAEAAKIAQAILGISLVAQNSDDADFHSLSVLDLEKALAAAYAAGRADGFAAGRSWAQVEARGR